MTEIEDKPTPPVSYIKNFVQTPSLSFLALKNDLNWERRGDAPRSEYYCNDFPSPYVYGRGKGKRLYEPRPYHPEIMAIRHQLEMYTGYVFEVCFLNRYMDQSDHLGWHSDDSPEMDDARPIASVSLGIEREIWFREKPPELVGAGVDRRVLADRRWHDRSATPRREDPAPTTKLLLEHGSLCMMAPGMQDKWQHRIPKCSAKCGERISLTFRGYIIDKQ